MKKLIYIASILLLGAVACTKELNEIENPVVEDKGQVAVIMKLTLPVDITATTKGANDFRDHLPKINAIRVAVFGTSSYPQAYTYAEPVKKTTDAQGKTVYVPDGATYAETNGDAYYFRVLLPVYEGEAHVHIIANGDESIPFLDQTENSIMSKMETTDDVGGYWARVVLPDGILAKLDDNGIMQTDTEGNFIASDQTSEKFENIVLIRNFAEISLTIGASAGISDVTWALVNDPVSGSIAPMAGTSYVDDYKDYIFDTKTGKMVRCEMETDPETGKLRPKRNEDGDIETVYATYNGYMVNSALNTLPKVEDDLDWTNASTSHFSYERVNPNKKNPAYIMLKAKFGTDRNYSYYRVDLMDENVGGYFPLYRNYKYQIAINFVGNRGASSFQEAALRNNGGNVSMSAETSTLTDVSDGFSRMYVQFVEKTYTEGGTKSFWVYYVPDITTGTVNNSSIDVSVKDAGTALANTTVSTSTASGASVGLLDVDEVKVVTFTLKDQSEDADLMSVLQVKASNGATGVNKSTLYRDITLKVMKKQDMDLSLAPDTVPEGTDKQTVLHIAFADTLQPSMFPLEFYIEDTNRTLNPTGKDGAGKSIDVPVKIGTSVFDARNTTSYYYIRTVNWDDYEPMRDAWLAAKEAGTSTDGIIDFTTQLKTIKASSETRIYVDNEYFNMGYVDLACASFSVSTTSPVVSYKAGTAPVTVSTIDGIDWTATVDNGGGLTKAAGQTTITGSGTETFLLNFDENDTAQQKVYTVTVTTDGRDPVKTTITQRRTPASPATFDGRSFTSTTASSDSGDGYLTVSLNVNGRSNDYLSLRSGNTITFAPKFGMTITEIVITYTNQNNRRDNSPQFSSDGSIETQGAAVTWTGSSASAITYTCGGTGTTNSCRVSSIRVKYN